MIDDAREKRLTTADFLGLTSFERKEELEDLRARSGAGAARAPERPRSADPSADDRHESLFAADEGQRFRAQWTEIQTAFVDEPRKAVENADHLVAETIQRLAQMFADERANLEHEWSRGDDRVSTEDLRLALRRYRSFFDRLLAV